jgi:hypothetical protein
MALAAYAFELGGAPKFSVFLLVAAWLVITISVFRHGFFAKSSNVAKRVYESLISLSVAVVLVVTWILLHPAIVPPQVVASSAASPNPTPSVIVPLQAISSPSQTPKVSPSPFVSMSPAVATQTPSLFPSDVKIGILQCSVSEYGSLGYVQMQGALCVARHQQTGQEFVGGTDNQGLAHISVPYGLYIVTVKSDGYITQSGSVRVDADFVDFGAILQKVRR